MSIMQMQERGIYTVARGDVMASSHQEDFLDLPSADFIASILPISHFQLDLETRVFSFDKNFGPMLGLPATARMTMDDFFARTLPREKYVLELKLLTVEQGYSSALNTTIQLLDSAGAMQWLEWSSVVDSDARTENCAGVKLRGILRHVSDSNSGQRDLLQSERWFMEVLEESPHALYRIDIRKNRFDYVSKGFANALGMTREEVLATPYTEFLKFHPDDAEKLIKVRDEIYKNQHGGRFTMYMEFRFLLKTGKYVWLNDTFTIVPGPDGQLAYQVGFGSVIEERKQLEEQLRQSNELLEERVKQRTIELRQANETLTRLMGQRQELEKKLLEISERERRFMGRELHDGLCQQIVGVMCMFEAVRARLARKKVAEESELTMMRDFLQDSVMQIRTLSRGLCPLALDPHSVGAALSTIAVQTSVLYKIECRFSGSVNVSVADADAALHLYRITQEAIQNGIRHGSAQKIAIGLTADSENINITIENDGRPLSVEAGKLSTKAVSEAGSGLGLKLIDYRVGLLRGTWKIENQPQNAGVRLTINAPIYGGNYNEATVA
ncbi:MAG TPA: hypothetical protein DCG57_17445 [Candidatus Riflebacteria bacterium]|nr:hypothetical protein [Candidatus Riflebacteria bacterium]